MPERPWMEFGSRHLKAFGFATKSLQRSATMSRLRWQATRPKNRVVANTSSIFHLPNFLLPTESPQQQDDVKTCWTYRELQEAARKDKQKADLIERC